MLDLFLFLSGRSLISLSVRNFLFWIFSVDYNMCGIKELSAYSIPVSLFWRRQFTGITGTKNAAQKSRKTAPKNVWIANVYTHFVCWQVSRLKW